MWDHHFPLLGSTYLQGRRENLGTPILQCGNVKVNKTTSERVWTK